MMDTLCGALMLVGSIFAFIASLGLLRFPDLLLRMHAATKAGTMGAGLILIALMLHFFSAIVFVKAILAILLIFITVPIGAHMIARAAYFINVPLWKGTICDELREHYNRETHELEGENTK
ncbi:MAG: Na+/H+ antiporter subunit G [Legionellaceae bacterium]|nr:Na+/H+ antiporter subunit G [Legionellaceae bacterium]